MYSTALTARTRNLIAQISQDETSEAWIGEWAEERGIRDQLIIATKVSATPLPPISQINEKSQYTSNFKRRDPSTAQTVNYVGNNNKSLHISVEASLKKLRTSYIDLLYVHWWDFETTIEEVMRSLHTLITSRKVLYLVR